MTFSTTVILTLLLGTPVAAPCPSPVVTRGPSAWYRATWTAPLEFRSPTVCEAEGGELVVMKRRKEGVEAYICSVNRTFKGVEIEAELARSKAEEVARRLVPTCPLRGKREVEVSGEPGSLRLSVSCIASVSPRDWCRDSNARPAPHGRGCVRESCPPGLQGMEFRGAGLGCIACPAGELDLKESLARNPDLFERASGHPFVPPTSLEWLCRADASAACIAPPDQASSGPVHHP